MARSPVRRCVVVHDVVGKFLKILMDRGTSVDDLRADLAEETRLAQGLESFNDPVQTVLEEARSYGFERVGAEFDIVLSKTLGVAVTSKGAVTKLKLLDVLKALRQGGFEGPLMLDVKDANAYMPLWKLLDANRDKLGRVVVCPKDAGVAHFHYQHNAKYYRQPNWIDPKFIYLMTIAYGMAEDWVKHYQSETCPYGLEWEPVPDGHYRKRHLETARRCAEIYYRNPSNVHNGSFNRQECLDHDLRFFKEHGLMDRVIFYGDIALCGQARSEADRIVQI